MMQAVHAVKPGSLHDPAAGAELVTVPVPEPKKGEVLKVLLRVVNPVDLFTLMGAYGPALPIEDWPIVPGLDGMGVVHKLGPGNGPKKICRPSLCQQPSQRSTHMHAKLCVLLCSHILCCDANRSQGIC